MNVLMRDIMDFSKEWVDKQMNKLIDMGVVFTYEKKKQVESFLENDQRTVSDLGIHADEGSQAPKRKKNTLGESKTKGKELVSQQKKKKKNDATEGGINSLSPFTYPSHRAFLLIKQQ